MRHLSPWRKEKGATAAKRKWCHGNDNGNGATATNPKMMPRQHIGSRQLMEIPVQKEACRERVMQDGGVIPATGFPRVNGMETSDNSHTVHLIEHMHSVMGVVSTVYLRSVHFRDGSRSVPCRGSRRSRASREVMVHAT